MLFTKSPKLLWRRCDAVRIHLEYMCKEVCDLKHLSKTLSKTHGKFWTCHQQ